MGNKIKPQAGKAESKARRKATEKVLKQIAKGTYKPPADDVEEYNDNFAAGWAACREQVLSITQGAYMDENVERGTDLGNAILALTRAISAATER